VHANQHIVTNGSYRAIRRLGYAGALLLWVGAVCATANWPAIAVVTPVIIGVCVCRIHCDETMLAESFGEQYQRCQGHTWKLIPSVY
jgi:protein-S-isoprenylcysteine O-methyltransferase Ste14